MNVVYVYEHEVYSDGVNFYHPYLYEILKSYDYFSQKIIVCCQVKAQDLSEYNSKFFLDRSKYTIYPIVKINSLKSLSAIKRNIKVMTPLIKKSDLIITKQPSFNGSFAINLAVKFRVKALVEVVGCAWDAYYHHSMKGKMIAPIAEYLTQSSVAKSDYVIYVTEKYLQRKYPNKKNNIGCSDVVIKTISRDELLSRISKITSTRNKRLKLLTLGGLDVKYKNQERVIKAIYNLNKMGYRFDYFLAGSGSGKRLHNYAEDIGVGDQIHILGTISHDEVFTLLDTIDLYIQPSLLEGLPRALIEAMGRGCPALGANVGGIPELLNSCCLFNPTNVNEITQILKNTTKERLQEMSFKNYEKSLAYTQEDRKSVA